MGESGRSHQDRGSRGVGAAGRGRSAAGTHDVIVDVEASGVNFLDATHRRRGARVPPPFVVGLEGAGRVSAVGADVIDVRIGDRVAWPFTLGSCAEQAKVPESAVVPVPDCIDIEVAAAVVAQGLTAHYLATDCYPVQKGDTVLVHAAAGGVGSLLVQIARHRGARVFGTVSSPAKSATAQQAGAEVLHYDDFEQRVADLTEGRGVDVVYDGVGRSTFDQSLAALARRGHLVSFGESSGPVPPFDIGRLKAAGSAYVVKPSLADFLVTREEKLRRSSELFGWIADGVVKVDISARFPFASAADAHVLLEERRSKGKLLLIP